VNKSGIIRWVGHVAQGFAVGDVRERDHLEDPGVDGRKILKWICSKWDRGMDWIGLAHDMVVL
jgi:hypothetical protein